MARPDLFEKIPLIGMCMVFLAMGIVAVTAYLHVGWYSIIGYAIAAVVAVFGFVMTFRDVRDTPGPVERWDAVGYPGSSASPQNLTRARTGSMTTTPTPDPSDLRQLRAARGGRGVPQGPQAPAAADDRDRRCHRHRTVPRCPRPTTQRRSGPVLELRVLRHLRLPHPAGPGRAGPAPAVVGVIRVVCARIPRREGGVRRRLDVLAELGLHGHCRLRRRSPPISTTGRRSGASRSG